MYDPSYQRLSRDTRGPWREFYFGRIHEGQGVDDVVAIAKPAQIDRFDKYTVIRYDTLGLTGLNAIAVDGRLVTAYAWTCTWTHVFFAGWSQDQRRQFSTRYEAHIQCDNESLTERTSAVSLQRQ